MKTNESIKYHLWAEDLLKKLVDELPEETTRKSILEGKKTYREIYIHKMLSMWWWIQLLKGEEDAQMPDVNKMTTKVLLEEFITLFHELQQISKIRASRKVLLDDEKTEWVLMDAQEIVFNILNHQTYHRGQIALGLGSQGKTIPESDYAPYIYQSRAHQKEKS